jgi:hypothetical protein
LGKDTTAEDDQMTRNLQVLCTALMLVGGSAGALAAQEAADSAAIDSLPVDSLSFDSSGDDTLVDDSLPDDSLVSHPVRRQGAGNPYLREVPAADQTRRRGPWYLSAGLGAGSERLADLGAPGPYSSALVRPTLNVTIGGSLGQHFRLGLEGFAWFNPQHDGVLESVATLMLGARLYPLASTGLYLHAAGGLGRYALEQSGDCGCSDVILQDFGAAWSVGGGYELPVGRGLWFGPTVEVVRMDVTGPGGYRERILNVGFSLTYDRPD